MRQFDLAAFIILPLWRKNFPQISHPNGLTPLRDAKIKRSRISAEMKELSLINECMRLMDVPLHPLWSEMFTYESSRGYARWKVL
jgi:hypothetical protein